MAIPLSSSRPFPLSAWIDAHSSARHNLGQSGMHGSLRSTPRLLNAPPAASVAEVVRRLASNHNVRPDRVFLTHGATEANFVVLSYLSAKAARRRAVRSVRIQLPEYPLLRDAAKAIGFRMLRDGGPAHLALMSNPRNPTGARLTEAEVRAERASAENLVVDETFREFGGFPSIAGAVPQAWVTGTFTKAYGADEVRAGWVIVPADETEPFARFHGVVTDGIPDYSIRCAASLLRHRSEVLEESRGIFRRNLRILHETVSDVPELNAPVWFDRGRARLPGDALALSGVRAGVLVCPGSFFGDAHGVRVGLTRRTFPQDLRAYVRLRSRFLANRPG